jgi:hypothetical protein
MTLVNQNLEGDLLRSTCIQIVNVNVIVWQLYTKNPVAPEDDPLWSKHVVLNVN